MTTSYEIRPLSRSIEVYEVRVNGRGIGTINAHKGQPHAIDTRSRVHYADSVEACARWLVSRMEGGAS